MKRMFLMATLASVALASCTTDESTFADAKKEIKFQSAIYTAQTRAEHDASLTPTENFRVLGWLEGKDATYMNEVVTPAGAIVSNATYYWPTDGSGLDFAAISPAASCDTYATTTRTSGETSIDFEFNAGNPNPNNINLMIADYVQGQKAETNSQVSLLFRHVLANLHINANQSMKEDAEKGISWEVTINSMSITNFKNQGKFSAPWNFDATAQDYYWSNADGNSTWSLITSAQSIKDADYASAGNYYVMPQEFDTEAPITLNIDYDITTTYDVNAQSTTVNYSKAIDLSKIKYNTATGTGVTLAGFAMNKDITITVNINPSAELTPITFAVYEEEWGAISGNPELKVD